MHPYRADVTTATPGPAFEPCIDDLLSIPEKDRQPLSVVSSCFFHVIFVEAVFQKPYICKSRIGFNAEVLGVHHPVPFFPCSWPRGRVQLPLPISPTLGVSAATPRPSRARP